MSTETVPYVTVPTYLPRERFFGIRVSVRNTVSNAQPPKRREENHDDEMMYCGLRRIHVCEPSEDAAVR